jgi:NitT/TauT family transport system ATP-binding protein
MPHIEIRDLHKTYIKRDGTPLPVLRNLSLDVKDGEFVCLLGPSGCGKSTTLDILAGLTRKDAGEVLVNGTADTNAAVFGYVFQRPRLLNWRTVRQNLAFALSAHRIPRSEWEERISRYLTMAGLEDFADAFPLTLSGGMQQRVALVRALVIEPDVLLMDEPFSSLDELTARRLRAELLTLWRRTEKTVLFVTHNALEAAFLSDRIYIVSNRPASLVDTVAVEVPRPRKQDDPRLIEVQKRVISVLEESGGMEDEISAAAEDAAPAQAPVADPTMLARSHE